MTATLHEAKPSPDNEPPPIQIAHLRAGLYKYEEAAEVLRVSTRTVKRLVKAGVLATIPVLKYRRIVHTELARFMAEGAQSQKKTGVENT